MRKPFEVGVKYDVIPGELALAVPKLMGILAKNGNNSNDFFRLQSSLQIFSRIHKLSIVGECTDWDSVARMASQGNGGNKWRRRQRKTH